LPFNIKPDLITIWQTVKGKIIAKYVELLNSSQNAPINAFMVKMGIVGASQVMRLISPISQLCYPHPKSALKSEEQKRWLMILMRHNRT
jgi:hypothetical protein